MMTTPLGSNVAEAQVPYYRNQAQSRFLDDYHEEVQEYLQDILTQVKTVLGCDWVALNLCKRNSGEVISSTQKLPQPGCRFALKHSLVARVLQSDRPLMIWDIQQSRDPYLLPEGYRCYLGLPIQLKGEASRATVCTFARTPKRYSTRQIQTAERLCQKAAIGVSSYELHRRQRVFHQLFCEETQAEASSNFRGKSQVGNPVVALHPSIESKPSTEEQSPGSLQTHRQKHSQSHQRRLAQVGEFSTHIIQELCNPLTTILLALGHFESLSLKASSLQRLDLATAELERIKSLVTSILTYARPHSLKPEEVELNAFMQVICDEVALTSVANQRRIRLESRQAEIFICIEPEKFEQIVVNLLENALEAIAPGEEVICELQATPSAIKLQIKNPAPDLSPADLEKLTQPFYSTKSQGVGLGLAIVEQLIEAHEGDFELASHPNRVVCASIELPRRLPSSVE